MTDQTSVPKDLVAVQQKWPRSTRDRLRNMVGAKSMTVTTLAAIEAWMDENHARLKEERKIKRTATAVAAGVAGPVEQQESVPAEQQVSSSESGAALVNPLGEPMYDTPETVEAKMKAAMTVVAAAQRVFGEDAEQQVPEQRVKSDVAVPEQRVEAEIAEQRVRPDVAEQRVALGSVEAAHVVTPVDPFVSPFVDAMEEVRQAVKDRRCPADGGLVLVRTKMVEGKTVLVSTNCRSCEWHWPK